jgi:hypothetical protein
MSAFKMFSKLLVVMILVLAAGVVNASDEKPSGTIKIVSTEVMALIGGSKGEGTLTFDGAEHNFKISGASVGASVGVQKLHISGEVYHLSDIADFAGVYFQVEAGITLVKGTTGMWLKNKKGVTLHLKTSNEGVALQLGSGGLKIAMK